MIYGGRPWKRSDIAPSYSNSTVWPVDRPTTSVGFSVAARTEGTDIDDLIDHEAIELLAARLKTPLQIEQHLCLAFEEAFRIGEAPVTAPIVEFVLSRQFDDLEPRLVWHGYTLRSLIEQFGTGPAEMRSFLRGELDSQRTRELSEQMQAAGLPI